MIRAAVIFLNNRMGTPILIGRDDVIKDKMQEMGLDFFDQMEIHSTRNKSEHDRYAEHIYHRLQRKGFLKKGLFRSTQSGKKCFCGMYGIFKRS